MCENLAGLCSGFYISYSLNSLKGGYMGDYIGDFFMGVKGHTRSLDYSLYV